MQGKDLANFRLFREHLKHPLLGKGANLDAALEWPGVESEIRHFHGLEKVPRGGLKKKKKDL